MSQPSPAWAEISGSLSDKNAAALYAAATDAAGRMYGGLGAETLERFRTVAAPHNHSLKQAIRKAATGMGLSEEDRGRVEDALLWEVQKDHYNGDPAKWGPSRFYLPDEKGNQSSRLSHRNVALYLIHKYNVVSHAGGELFYRYQDGVYVNMERKPADTYADADPNLTDRLSNADMVRINKAAATLGGQLTIEEMLDQRIMYTAKGVKKMGPLGATSCQDGQDRPRYKINCLNKILLVSAGGVEAVDHAREHVMLYMVQTEYVPDSKCPKFCLLVEASLAGDKVFVLTIEECMAATFLPGVFGQRRIVMLNGTQDGGNGKGIIMDMLRNIIGIDYTCDMSPGEFDFRWGPKRAYDKIANINTETNLAMVKNPVNYLSATGGGVLTIEFKGVNKEVRTAIPIWHWHAYNTAPEVAPTAYAIFRRIAAVVDFSIEFENQQTDRTIDGLADNLQERRGVFAMLVGLMPGLIRAGRLTHRQTNAQIKEQVLGAGNTAISFINHALEAADDNSRILFADMYERYVKWMRANHPGRPPVSERRFAQALSDAGFIRGPQARDGKRFYVGVKYRQGAGPPGEPRTTLDSR